MLIYESAKSRGLRGNVGYLGPWVRGLRGSNIYMGCVGYVGQNIFYVGHNFYVGCVGQIHFCVGQTFLRGYFRGLKFFAWVQQFLLGLIFGGLSKKISIGAFKIIS